MTLVNLAENDQRHREVIEQAEPAVQVDRGLRGLDSLRLAAIGERAIGHRQIRLESRLEPEIAHFLRGLEAAQAGLDAALRIERAVQYAEVRVPPAGLLQ